MKRMNVIVISVISLFLGVISASAQEHSHGGGEVGEVNFPISCGPEAQDQFNHAAAVLYSFWYDEALKSFTSLTERYPECAMGYWGIAMSLWHPLWAPPSKEELKRGWAAVEKARAVGTKTDREHDYLGAIEAFYGGWETTDHRTRALAYEKGMERVYLRYPEDRNAAVFYALALNATALPTDKTYSNQLKAGKILEEVFREQPRQPGVAHYIIHSYDYPPLASQALDAARRYAEIAPAVAHALHMPSHIFTRLGLWQESIGSNSASEAAARAHNSLYEQLHAMDYLAYAYLQGAQDGEAKKVLDECNVLVKREGETNFASLYPLAAIPARFALERKQWAEAAKLEPAASRNYYTEAVTYFARGIGLARTGDVGGARKDVEKLESLREALKNDKQDYWADQVEIQRRATAAWLAFAEGKKEEALPLMRSSADLEASTEKHPVTPGAVLPASELLGDMLLELGMPGEAFTAFETSLESSPNRFNGYYGAARAARRMGDLMKARKYYQKLLAVCQNSDSDRPGLQEAREYLAEARN